MLLPQTVFNIIRRSKGEESCQSIKSFMCWCSIWHCYFYLEVFSPWVTWFHLLFSSWVLIIFSFLIKFTLNGLLYQHWLMTVTATATFSTIFIHVYNSAENFLRMIASLVNFVLSLLHGCLAPLLDHPQTWLFPCCCLLFGSWVCLFRILVWFIWNLAKPTLSSLFLRIRKFLGSFCCVVGILSIWENSCLILIPRLFQTKNLGNINLCTFAYLLTKYPTEWKQTPEV